MHPLTQTLTQNQQAIRFVARLLLERTPGERLPAIQEINSQLGVGVGTVQKAISTLHDAGAVMLTARGHRGTFVEELDYAGLWRQAGHGPVKLVLPFVDAPEFSGLSDAIDQQLGEHGIPARIDHRRGARARLHSVQSGAHDACVVSELAWHHARLPDLEAVAIAGAQYYQPQSVALLTRRQDNKKTGTAKLRVGYDPDSLDHYLLTQAEFPSDDDRIEWVACRYSHLLSVLLAGVIDCGIWHHVAIGVALELLPITAQPLAQPATLALLKRCKNACFVVRRDRPDVRHLLQVVDGAVVKAAQHQARRAAAMDLRTLGKLINRVSQGML